MAQSHEESLRELLARVHDRLDNATTVDAETRQLLVALTREIEHALGSRGTASGAPLPAADVAPASGGERRRVRRESLTSLEGLAARFDADHPALAQTLRQLVDFLGKAGI